MTLLLPLSFLTGRATEGLPDPEANLSRQVALFPQEKIHLHTDRALFASGDTVWFSGYLVNASTHIPDTSSRYIYVELISPFNQVEKRVKIRQNGGAYHGYLELDKDLTDGEYVIRAYTQYMTSLDDDYFFRKKIRVLMPFFLFSDVRADFSFSGKDNRNVKGTFGLREKETGFMYKPEIPRFQLNDPDEDLLFRDIRYKPRDTTVDIWFRLPEENSSRNLLVMDFDKYRKFIPVPVPALSFDVGFYPESGYLVAGEINTVGFKALREDGLPYRVRGIVRDQEGNEEAVFESFNTGMGSFPLFAEAGKVYTAICVGENDDTLKVTLPAVPEHAYGIKVTRTNDRIYITVPGGDKSDVPLSLFIHNRGRTVLSAPWEGTPVEIRESDYPSGIYHALLLNPSMDVLNERLFFCYGNEESIAELRAQEEYLPREKVSLGVTLTDGNGAPVTGRFSVSVTDDFDVKPDTLYNIASSLLLNSELRGFVENPARYLGNDPMTRSMLDALLLTQGWRRYDLPEVVKGSYRTPAQPLELGDEISGTITKIIGETPFPHAPVNLFVPNYLYFQETVSDENGRFYLNGFEFPDRTEMFVSALTEKGKKRLSISIDKMEFPEPVIPFIFHEWKEDEPEQLEMADNLKEKTDRMYIDEYGMRMIEMAKITIVGTKWPDHYLTFGRWARKSFDSDKLEKMEIRSMRDLIESIGFLEIVEGRINFMGTRRGEASIVIDNMPIAQDFFWILEVDNIELLEIAYLDDVGPLLGTDPGKKHRGGQIRIITKNGFNPQGKKRREIFNREIIVPPGYQLPKEFYAPKYDRTAPDENVKADVRTTIHWAPAVRTGADGTAEVEFYTADMESTYTVVVEGMSDDGRMIYATRKITVN